MNQENITLHGLFAELVAANGHVGKKPPRLAVLYFHVNIAVEIAKLQITCLPVFSGNYHFSVK